MAKLCARGREEYYRAAKETTLDSDELLTWKRVTRPYMTDGHILEKRDVRFKPDRYDPAGRLHSYGWKDAGKFKAEVALSATRPAALRVLGWTVTPGPQFFKVIPDVGKRIAYARGADWTQAREEGEAC